MTYEPLSPMEAEERMRTIARRLLDAIDEQSKAGQELASAKADYHKAFNEAHVSSYIDHPDRKVGQHKSAAELTAADTYRSMVVAESKDRCLREESHSLRQVLSSLQTNARAMAREYA